MGKAKTKKPAARSKKPAAKVEKIARSSSVAAPAKSHSEAERLLASLPPLTDVERAAFASQFSDARCDSLGTQTQSAAVYKDALAFAHAIDATLKKNAAQVRRYGHARFAWLLECVADLGRARDEQSSGKNSAAPARRTLDHAIIRGAEVRRELIHILELLVGDHETNGAELEAARGTSSTPQALVESLNDLARLADGWLRRTDGESKALVASVDLQRGDADLAWAAAQELDDAIERASGKKLSGGRDTQPVNRAEGRVILEMRYAMGAFAHAAEGNKAIPRLVPGAGTRNVLAPKARPKMANGKSAPAAAPPN